MYLIQLPWLKIRIQEQNQLQKQMEIKQCLPETSMGQGRN